MDQISPALPEPDDGTDARQVASRFRTRLAVALAAYKAAFPDRQPRAAMAMGEVHLIANERRVDLSPSPRDGSDAGHVGTSASIAQG
jgi:hypothetical protein